MEATDPVNQHEDGSWWYWNETWSDEHGPYMREGLARISLAVYCKYML